MYPVSSSVLNFILTWAPPTFLNGDLERYEICIGEDGVTGSATCVQPSDCLYLHASESDSAKNLVGCTQLGVVDSPQEPTTDIGYHVVAETELLFLQIRGVNSFNLLGEWSDPLLIYNSSSDASGAQGSGSEATGNREWIYVVVSMLCLVVLALGALLVLWVYRHFCFHRRIKYENTMTMERIHGNYYPPTFIPVADDWEVPSEDVEIFYSEELGHGAFGRVYRGLLHCRELRDLVTGGRRSTRKRGSFGQRRLSRRKTSQSMGSRLVAIKRLRDNIDGADKANFLKEIEMIKKVSGANHDHQKFVVNMLGCVTVQEPMMLVLEYVTHGDLLTYLRNSREGDEGATNPKAAPYLEPKGAYSKLPPRAPGQEGEGEEEEDHKLTETDLLSFARQIAAGMEFLASLSVVHRDLACRNILVCENSLVKISDFGLSRTLVNQEAYVTTTKGVLPIRWMAPEALFYRTFDTQSDVWSYGILLWELYTLGGYPYPTMSNRDIIDLLSRGYRMDKPELCTNQVYSVMLQCWSSLGVERPDFRELYLVFDNMLSESTRQQSPYIQVLGTCYYDKLGPRVQVDSDTLDLENIPANVDMRQLTTNSAAPTAEAAFGTSLPENGNGFLSVSAVAQPQSQDHSGASAPVNQGLGVPLDLSRPRSWVGTSTAELGPRYVPAPLYCASPHSSVSNLTQETTFGSTAATVSPEHGHRLLSTLQSRSVGSLPLLTNPPALHQTTRL
ncbi:Fibroblast growth factor receptor 2 [Geodia barretti]|nr:Fibroblast growth factor receptor 2 [Geodia barretti]